MRPVEIEERLLAVRLSPKLFGKPYLDLNQEQKMAVGMLASTYCRGQEKEREQLGRILREVTKDRCDGCDIF